MMLLLVKEKVIRYLIYFFMYISARTLECNLLRVFGIAFEHYATCAYTYNFFDKVHIHTTYGYTYTTYSYANTRCPNIHKV